MAENKSDDIAASNFDRAHRYRLQNRTLERVWQHAYGDDYPAEVMPSAFYSLSALRRLVQALGPMEGQMLVDLGCGHGGAGLWVAKQLGMNLIGIDQSPGGISLAKARAADMGLADRAKFQVGDVTSTGLTDASCGAAISLDVLVFVEDKAATIREIARILKSGGRFGFTTWEQAGYSERLKSQQFSDYRPLLTAAGFDVEVYEEPSNWRQQHQRTLELLIKHQTELEAEMESVAASGILAMARGSLNELPSRRYVLAVGRRH